MHTLRQTASKYQHLNNDEVIKEAEVYNSDNELAVELAERFDMLRDAFPDDFDLETANLEYTYSAIEKLQTELKEYTGDNGNRIPMDRLEDGIKKSKKKKDYKVLLKAVKDAYKFLEETESDVQDAVGEFLQEFAD